ncbi:hypothetical protein NDU88_004847 [Pleurodeles waltl]|uniref:Uncharacterized protein n=1 Tax=Pleurodeles waltl TaxID=8319 RepID=A0AAV7LVV0_PLEWA|nr:hypothetical protein NDU88_004847 [Pleurodeles waltl]
MAGGATGRCNAAGDSAEADRGTRKSETRLEAGEAVGHTAVDQPAGEHRVMVLCSGLGVPRQPATRGGKVLHASP